LKLLFKAIVYLPQLITSYLFCRLILGKADTAMLWLTAIVTVAYLIHFVIIILKQVIIALRNKGNLLWIPLLAACLVYTCIFPVWIIFNPVKELMNYVSAEKATILTWLLSISFGIYLYLRYDFFNLRSS